MILLAYHNKKFDTHLTFYFGASIWVIVLLLIQTVLFFIQVRRSHETFYILERLMIVIFYLVCCQCLDHSKLSMGLAILPVLEIDSNEHFNKSCTFIIIDSSMVFLLGIPLSTQCFP